MATREEITLFDRYLRGEMEASEKDAFEVRLEKSEKLREKFNDYMAFSDEIKAGMEYAAIQDELGEIHESLYGNKKKRGFVLKPSFLVPVGIAATIALLVLFNPFNGGMSDKAEGGYSPLANNSDDAYTEESATEVEDYVGESEADYEEGNIAQDSMTQLDYVPHGTAFLISKTGFFLTSKHLVESRKSVQLQQKDLNINFEADVVYCDSILDLAILQCKGMNFEDVPFEWYDGTPQLGDEVFTLGYPKKDVVYTEGVVSSETGYDSDSIYFEISLPSNAGHSGAPLFNIDGALIGIITAQHSDQQAVTYALKHTYIQDKLEVIADSLYIDMSSNYSKRRLGTGRRIKLYRPFVFELH